LEADLDAAPEVPIDLDAYEKVALERALAASGQDVDEAARMLKIGLSTLYRKMKRHGIPHPRATRRNRESGPE
jgi:DNA-binding NtrC family response regulator